MDPETDQSDLGFRVIMYRNINTIYTIFIIKDILQSIIYNIIIYKDGDGSG